MAYLSTRNLTEYPFKNDCLEEYKTPGEESNEFNLCLLTSKEVYELSKDFKTPKKNIFRFFLIVFSEVFHQHFQKPIMLELDKAGQEATLRIIDARIAYMDILSYLMALFVAIWLGYLVFSMQNFVKKVSLWLNLDPDCQFYAVFSPD